MFVQSSIFFCSKLRFLFEFHRFGGSETSLSPLYTLIILLINFFNGDIRPVDVSIIEFHTVATVFRPFRAHDRQANGFLCASLAASLLTCPSNSNQKVT